MTRNNHKTVGFTLLLSLQMLSQTSFAAAEICSGVTIGFPQLSVTKAFIDESAERARTTERNRNKLRETNSSLTIEPGQTRNDIESAFRMEDALIEIINLENEASYFFRTRDEANFEEALSKLEDRVIVDIPIDEFNRSRHVYRYMTLLKVYALTDFNSKSRDRLSKMKSAIDFAKKHSIESESLDSEIDRGAPIRDRIMSLHLNSVVLKVASLEGDIGAIDHTISSLRLASPGEKKSAETANSLGPVSERKKEAFETALHDESQLALANALIVKGVLTGKTQYFDLAVQELNPILSYDVSKCNAVRVGKAALLRSRANLQSALLEKDAGKRRTLLREADDSALIARRLLEQLHFPALWSMAHSLSSDIYEQLEIISTNKALKDHFKNLKIRSHELSQSV